MGNYKITYNFWFDYINTIYDMQNEKVYKIFTMSFYLFWILRKFLKKIINAFSVFGNFKNDVYLYMIDYYKSLLLVLQYNADKIIV